MFVVVEPEEAACLLSSARMGELVEAPSPVQSAMVGLAAGRPSDVAWTILSSGADAFLSISDESAVEARDRFTKMEPALASAEPSLSAIAGLAALFTIEDEQARDLFGISAESRILTIGTDRETGSEPA
jgi:diaminopropionate ammonia-lyase